MKAQPSHYEPVEFVDTTPRPDGQGGWLPDVETVYRTMAKATVTREKRNWVTSQVLLPAGLQLTMWVRQEYEPGTDTKVRFRGQDYTIQSKTYADESTRREWVLTLLSNGQRSTDTGAQQPATSTD